MNHDDFDFGFSWWPAAAEALAVAYSRARTDLPRLLGRLPAMAKAAVATRRPT
jgi:hypothetical protein